MKRRTRRAFGDPPTGQAGAPVITLPEHWSPEQALAVFEIVDELRERLWHEVAPEFRSS